MKITNRDIDEFVHWIIENKKMMEYTGAFNLTVVVPQDVLDAMRIIHNTGLEYYQYTPGNTTVRVLGLDMIPHMCNYRREQAVQLVAEGMNLTRSDITPITKSFSPWPIRPNAEKLIAVMEAAKAWCLEKESAFFQKRDVMRVAKCSAHMASEALKYYQSAGDIECVARKWWFFHNMPQNKQGRPSMKYRKVDIGLQRYQKMNRLVELGLVSKQTAMNELGIDYKKEMQLMRQERMYRENLALSSGPTIGVR